MATSISYFHDFHGVVRIVIGPENRCGRDFVTRRICLVDDHGEELVLTCYTDRNRLCMPVCVQAREEDEEDAA